MNIKPLGNNIIVEPVKNSLTTESGLILSSSDEADKAKVVAVGSDVVDVQVNDVLLINWKKAQKLDGETYRVSVEEVIAVLED